jgi:hypothetical protein
MFKHMRILPRFTFANVVAILALFVALGGTAAAAFVVNSNADIAPGTVFGSVKPAAANDNVVAGSLGTNDLAAGSVTTTKVANGAITPAKLAVLPLAGHGRASFDRVTIPVGQSRALLPLGGLGNLVLDCMAQQDATIAFHNNSGHAETVAQEINNNPEVDPVANGASSPTGDVGFFQGHFDFQVDLGTGNKGAMATIDMYLTTDATTCSLQAQGVALAQ